jgi:hypothetical protein
VRQRLTASAIRYAGLASGALAAALLPGARRAWAELADRLGADGLERLVDLYAREGYSLEAAFDLASSAPAAAAPGSPRPVTGAPASLPGQVPRGARTREVAPAATTRPRARTPRPAVAAGRSRLQQQRAARHRQDDPRGADYQSVDDLRAALEALATPASR